MTAFKGRKNHPSILGALKGGLVASCQPVDGGPMDDPMVVAALAQAAVDGGAVGLRIEGIDNLLAVRSLVDVPIVGIVKTDIDSSPVRITVSKADVHALIAAGADVVAYDATDRPRTDSADDVLSAIHNGGALAMADCSSFEDAKRALANGAQILGTTLSGYTADSETDESGPDLDLVRKFAKTGAFVMAEGRINTPCDAHLAMRAGANSVTVGTSLTRLEIMTERFVNAVRTGFSSESLSGFALDLGGTKTAAARIENGKVVERLLRTTDGSKNPGDFLDEMSSMLSELGFDGASSVGVAVTGRVDHQGSWYAINRRTLSKVDCIPLRHLLGSRWNNVHVINDAAAATLAEQRLGAGLGASEFAYITVSTGVAGGLVLNGELVQSEDGMAGHFGFSTTNLGTELCGSGRYGTVESAASGKAIAAAAQALGKSFDAREVFERARAGEEWAGQIFDRSAKAIAELVMNLAAIVGVRRFAIGGSVGLSDGYIQRVQDHIDWNPSEFRAKTAAAELGGDGPLLGALLATLESREMHRYFQNKLD